MSRTIKRPMVWILSALFIALVMGTIWRLDQLEALRNMPENPAPPLLVEAVPVRTGPISRWVCGEGTATAVQQRHLIFKTPGTVVFLGTGEDGTPLHEGSRVKGPSRAGEKGDCLARLDSRDIKEELRLIRARQEEAAQELEIESTGLDQAKKDLDLAKNKYDRSKKLYDRKALPLSVLEENETAWQSALSSLKAARARIKSAKASAKGLRARYDQTLLRLEDTALFAPFDGVVARLNISQGDLFQPSSVDLSTKAALQATAPITLIDPGLMEITLNLPVFDGLEVAPGQKTLIQWGSMDWYKQGSPEESSNRGQDDHTLEGRVYSVSPVLNISGRTVRVKVRARQDKPLIPYGLFGTCWIEVERKEKALLVPTAALLFRDGLPFVYVADNGIARQRAIKIGLADKKEVEVMEGLGPKEWVITRGRYRLFPDRPVKIIEQKEKDHVLK